VHTQGVELWFESPSAEPELTVEWLRESENCIESSNNCTDMLFGEFGDTELQKLAN
jgi:hypothetical protein